MPFGQLREFLTFNKIMTNEILNPMQTNKPTLTQIEYIKSLKPWTNLNFHGNTKKINGVPIESIKGIVLKKRYRENLKYSSGKITPIQQFKECYNHFNQYKGTPYCKIMIEGNTGIYFASPIYLHQDYNKTRLFDKSEYTIKLLKLFTSLTAKK